ncbi:hypothetical protein [Nocardia caishijiensis]|uniref:PPE family protein n=1 Tax=Nocardia caishijiensis TaxID=184756 RepID=A0ABQ6YR41_9NOCA|nr:hypothetical protein [Nocardia caishijiensis]KAF0848264.1 hypothetical protein FNL39_102412 [Nocardia caishijiensis]
MNTVATEPSAMELLRASAIGPALDLPVSSALANMGVPALPQLPALPALPDLPALPLIDMSALVQPLTDLAAGFGTGQIGTGTAFDPTEALSNAGTIVQAALEVGVSALQTLMQEWEGEGADAASSKAQAVQQDSTEVAAQSAEQKSVVTQAAASVAKGLAQLTAITARFIATATAAAPLVATPGGQAALLGLAAEAGAEALAVVAQTRAELTAHTASMNAAGTKVDVTSAPSGMDSSDLLSQLSSLITPLFSLATTVSEQLTSALTGETTTDTTTVEEPVLEQDSSVSAGAGGMGAGGGAVGGIGGLGAVAPALGAWNGGRSSTSGTTTTGAATEAATASASSGGRGAVTSGPGMMPLAGMANAARAGDASSGLDLRTNLVTGEHGDEVIGDIADTAQPVVGAAAQRAPRSTQVDLSV